MIGLLFGKHIGGWFGKRKLLQRIGKLSFSIYLFHYLILFKLNIYIQRMWLKGIVLLILTLAVSFLVYRFVEEPAMRWKRKR